MQDLDYYMKLNHPILITHTPDCCGYFFGEIPLLKGCMADGDTIEEFYQNMMDAKELWLIVTSEEIENPLFDVETIPEPKDQGFIYACMG